MAPKQVLAQTLAGMEGLVMHRRIPLLHALALLLMSDIELQAQMTLRVRATRCC